MHSNTLTNLLKTFSAIELKEFSDFLKSPFYNKRNAVVNLYNIIVRYHPGYDSEILSKEKIFNKLFPGKKYKDATLRVLMHYLTELAEKYLVYSRVGKENFEYALLLNKELQERGQFKLLEKKVVQNSGMLEDADLDSEDYFYYKHRIDFDTFHNVNVANSGVYERSLNKATLENVFNSLTNFYLFRSMRMYLNFLTL